MTIRQRLRTLENRHRSQPASSVSSEPPLSISDELTRDDPQRIAQFLAAMRRAGFLDQMPADDDDSNMAQVVRLAVSDGFVSFGGIKQGIR